MANGGAGMKALRGAHESVLLSPKCERKFIPAGLVEFDGVERIGKIDDTVITRASSNGGHDLVIFGDYRCHGRSDCIERPEIDRHPPGSYRCGKGSHCYGNILPDFGGVTASGKSLECYGAISLFAMFGQMRV
ncbi:UNVERIFIED_CONTAM: hypothetical protein K2H54_039307 [Gekko kuhli]